MIVMGGKSDRSQWQDSVETLETLLSGLVSIRGCLLESMHTFRNLNGSNAKTGSFIA
jgi:hypothetical protein